MIVNVPLEMIVKNPWQTRLSVDQAHIKDLAEDIAANGLLQTPLGRLAYIDGAGLSLTEMTSVSLNENGIEILRDCGLVLQLAFGHNRFEAYKLNLEARGGGWNCMPVEIRVLSDEQMADYAWAENERRQDLSPIERAKAIQKRIDHFGWTHQQMADRMLLNQSTVANILRLLRLPDDLQVLVQEGKISERQALALLPLVEFPGMLQKEVLEIIKAAERGESSEETRERVGSLIDLMTKDLKDALWPLEHIFSIEGIQAPMCYGCDQRIRRGRSWRCLVPECFNLKEQAWKAERVQAASQDSGILIMKMKRKKVTEKLPFTLDLTAIHFRREFDHEYLNSAGIYILMQDDNVYYAGQTDTLSRRNDEHWKEDWTDYWFIPITREVMNQIEHEIIKKLKPIKNKTGLDD